MLFLGGRTGIGGTLLTLARFLRHSVHAFGVTTPKPRLLFVTPCRLPVDGPGADETEEGDGPGAEAGCFPDAVCGESGGARLLRPALGGAGESSSIGSIAALDAARAIGSTKDLVSLN